VAPKILERGLGIDSNTAWAPAFKNNHDPAHFPPTPPLIFLPRWWQHSYPLELENRLIGRSELPASVALIAEQCLRRFSLVCASICCKSSPRNCKICDPPVNRHTEPRKSNNEPLDRKPPGAPPTWRQGGSLLSFFGALRRHICPVFVLCSGMLHGRCLAFPRSLTLASCQTTRSLWTSGAGFGVSNSNNNLKSKKS